MPIDTSMYRDSGPDQQPDLLGMYAKHLSLKQMMEEAPIRRQIQQQQLESGRQEIESGRQTIAINRQKMDLQEQSLRDQKTAQQIIARHGGNVEKALPELASAVSPTMFTTIRQGHVQTLKDIAALDKDRLEMSKVSNEQLFTLTEQAFALPDEQYAAAWPAIKARALTLNKELQLPDEPISKDQLRQYGLGLLTTEQYLKAEDERRKRALEKPALDKATADALAAQQKVAGTEPVQPKDKLTIDATAARDKSNAAHQTVMEGIARTNANANVTRANKAGQTSDIVQIGIEEAAKSLANGDLTRLKDITSLRGDQRLAVFTKARQINPTFNLAEVDRKIKMEDYYANGKGADSLRSFGIFLEHGGAASEAVNQIRLSKMPVINKPINWWREHMSGAPEFTQLVAALEPVRKEFESFLLGGRALYAEDRKAAEVILNENSSPAQIQQALKTMAHTAEARLNEENHRYKKVMGKTSRMLCLRKRSRARSESVSSSRWALPPAQTQRPLCPVSDTCTTDRKSRKSRGSSSGEVPY